MTPRPIAADPLRFSRRRFLFAAAAAACLARPLSAAAGAPAAKAWYKGNVHTHSLWSDGRDMPELVADWYKSHGYQFLIVTDHNILQEGVHWADVGSTAERKERFDLFRKQFPDVKVETREGKDPKTGKMVPQATVRPLAAYRGQFEEPGKFLLIHGEEITDSCTLANKRKVQVHMNTWNLTALVPPQHGKTVRETLVNDLAAADKQGAAQKPPTLTVLNHPNWGGVVPVEDFQDLPNLSYFEILNEVISGPDNQGDAKRLSTDRLWDVALAARLGRLGLGPIYGIAADDSHAVTGRGGCWIVVRAADLSPESLIAAVKAADFYASNGVRLKDVQRGPGRYAVAVEPEDGVTYTIQFIGTLRGYDRGKEEAKDAAGALLPPTERYSPEIGKVLKEVKGTEAAYTPTGDELYVRAKIVSSKPKTNPDGKGLTEIAWTQPMVVGK